jgi:hypothetical protein
VTGQFFHQQSEGLHEDEILLALRHFFLYHYQTNRRRPMKRLYGQARRAVLPAPIPKKVFC